MNVFSANLSSFHSNSLMANSSPMLHKTNLLTSKKSISITNNIQSVRGGVQLTACRSGGGMNQAQLLPQQSVSSSSGTDGSKTDLMNLKFSHGFTATTTTTTIQQQHSGVTMDFAGQLASTPCSHQVTSMNESKAKQVCKKRAHDVICHTETQLIRCYPNARRFDSSNFSPIHFWSCGIQLVALNYQTVDCFQILNQAMFEQNGNTGYVLKPPVLWDRMHPEYGKFNPFEKKKDNEYILFHLKIISGQFLTEASNISNNYTGNGKLVIKILIEINFF